MPKDFISNFNIQYIISCFVTGHFVIIIYLISFYKSNGGIANQKIIYFFLQVK